MRKPDELLTADLSEALKHKLEYFTPEDKDDDTDNHTLSRIQSQEPVNMVDDKYFTLEEIRNAIERMGNKKVPGEDGINGEIYKRSFEIFPNYITAM